MYELAMFGGVLCVAVHVAVCVAMRVAECDSECVAVQTDVPIGHV